ncbi:MAG TPA: calcium-binding protein [Kofleriaceae bacterium]|nr:calcium-binding protein [Kofleriaceae bacterium]
MSARSFLYLALFPSLATTVVTTACLDLPDDEVALDDTEQAATASYTAKVKTRTLTITGTSAPSSLTLRNGATAGRLEVDVGSDGSAEFSFDRSTFEKIVVDAAGGDDVVVINEQGGAYTSEEKVTIRGGTGNDTLQGGVGPETFDGGTGRDTVIGGLGLDTIDLGDGDDTVAWRPGDASDVIEGGAGLDRLSFLMASIGENIGLGVQGDHLRLTRDIGTVTLDGHGLELVELTARGGADRITIDDLTPAAIARVDVDLAYTIPTQGDGVADAIVLNGTAGADVIDVSLDVATGDVVASGLGSEIRVRNGELAFDRLVVNGDASDRVDIDGTAAADTMIITTDGAGRVYDGGAFNVYVAPAAAIAVTVNGNAGDDHIATTISDANPVVIDGGAGNDQIVGGPGPDRITGGTGNDHVDGRYAADAVSLGDGEDTFVWDPGDASDVVEGGAGLDALVLSGSNIGERFDVRAVAGRVRVVRDIATVTLDLGGFERADLSVRGGADIVTVGSLAGTTLAQVNVDLPQLDGSNDGLLDQIVIDGVAGVDTIDVAADGDAVLATGLGAPVRVRRGEPAVDRVVVRGGRLNVNGTVGPDVIQAFGESGGAVIDGGGYNALVQPAGIADVRLLGYGGDDTLAATSVAIPLTFDGGAGNDSLFGGAAADTLLGGLGNDQLSGRLGADTVRGGDGDDTLSWNPGDASDRLDGEAGNDTLVFSGANIGEVIELRASGARTLVLRNIGTVTTDLGTIEHIALLPRGGTDTIQVGDLAGTGITRVDVDLGSSGLTDAVQDTVTVLGTPAADIISVTSDGTGVVIFGLATTVRVGVADFFDRLDVRGEAGVDQIDVAPDAAAMMLVTAVD